MKKILFTNADGGVSIVIPAPKENIEKALGTLTEDEYKAHVYLKSVPESAIKVRDINEVDIPASREFRNAWADVTEESRIDIDCEKARDLKLEELRAERNLKLNELDKTYQMMSETGRDLAEIKAEKQALRDITTPIKALDVAGKINNSLILDEIRKLSTIQGVQSETEPTSPLA